MATLGSLKCSRRWLKKFLIVTIPGTKDLLSSSTDATPGAKSKQAITADVAFPTKGFSGSV
jgi:hypothetical protein